MPCGGGDIGMNVWVEDDDVFFYLCRSGSFDENNTLLKQGRFRIRLTPNPFAGRSDFRQTLHLKDGYVSVTTPVGADAYLGGCVPSCGACGGGNQGSDLHACQL